MATSTPNQQRILIVEDEENARKGYEALLRKWNWEILGVGSGEEALAKFQEFQPSLILADVELPGMNGLDLLKQLGDEILRIPVIIITGRGSDERVVAGHRSRRVLVHRKAAEASRAACPARTRARPRARPASRRRAHPRTARRRKTRHARRHFRSRCRK